jgi:hypothetical protein
MRAALGQRVIMFFLGVIMALPVSLRLDDSRLLGGLIGGGVAALLVYEIMYRSRKWLRLYTLPVYLGVGFVIWFPLREYLAALITFRDIPPAIYLYSWLEPEFWTRYFGGAYVGGTYLFFPTSLVNAALVVLIAYMLLRGLTATDVASDAKGFAFPTGELGVPSGGYGGIEMDSTRSQTTRFLSASALLLGASFRSQVLHYVREKYRAVAPELGMDLGLLVRVCAFMENRETTYRALFLLLGVIAVLVGFVSVWVAIAVFVLGAWALQGYKSYEERRRLPQFFSKDRYDPDAVADKFAADLDAELTSGIPTDGQNTVVYKGFSPFVGAGIDLGGWSFAVDLSLPKQQMGKEEEPILFTASELNAHIEDAIKSLGFEGAVVKDCLFVNGVDIREDRAILPRVFGRPAQQVTPETLAQYMSSTDSRVRHYKWIRVHDWGNELVTSHFLRCVLKGQNLFVEISRFLLTPLDTQYRNIDAATSTTRQQTVGLFLRALIVGPFAALGAWLALLVKGGGFVSRILGFGDRQQRREISRNPLYDYGVAQSLRESVSSQRFVHYFQRLDREMYVKIIEREMLDTIVEFLDDHNIDTSDIKQRQTMIMNQGLIVQGGDVQAQSLAVGAGAQAVLTGPAAQQAEGSRSSTRKS